MVLLSCKAGVSVTRAYKKAFGKKFTHPCTWWFTPVKKAETLVHHVLSKLEGTPNEKSGITVTKDRSSIDTFRFVHSHPMGQSVGYFNLTKILFVLLMLLNAFVEVREGSEFDMRETDAAFPAVP